MPRVFWFVLVAGVLVWVGAFMDVGGKPRPSAQDAPTSEPEPEPEAQRVARPIETRAQPKPASPPPAPPPATLKMQPGQSQPSSAVLQQATAAMRSVRQNTVRDPAADYTVPNAPAAEPQDEATGELGEGVLSPEYVAFERAYAYEPRDGEWATKEESQLRDLISKSPIGKYSTLVNCQQTICRVLLENAPKNAFGQLLQVPGLLQITGLANNSPYSYRSGQLSVYFTRRSALPAGPSP